MRTFISLVSICLGAIVLIPPSFLAHAFITNWSDLGNVAVLAATWKVGSVDCPGWVVVGAFLVLGMFGIGLLGYGAATLTSPKEDL